MRPQIAIITYDRRAHIGAHHTDDLLLREALRRMGADATIVSWKNPNVDPTAFDAVVLRSCWDSYRNPAAFLDWLASVDKDRPRLVNRRDVLEWNFHKAHYLSDLTAAFPPDANRPDANRPDANPSGQIVPSLFLSKHEQVVASEGPFHSAIGKTFGEMVAELDEQVGTAWRGRDIVVKPAISASGENTFCFCRTADENLAYGEDILPIDKAPEIVQQLLGNEASPGIIVQPLLAGIKNGEYSLVYIDGKVSFAIHKVTNAGDFQHRAEANRLGIHAADLPPHMRDFADQLISYVTDKFGPEAITYARVDIVQESAELPILLELELVEPSLQFVRIPEMYYGNTLAPSLSEIQQGDAAMTAALEQFAKAILGRIA
ncbi:MAG: hypothetical protein AAF702_06595 [Chloroflexota bacterium]